MSEMRRLLNLLTEASAYRLVESTGSLTLQQMKDEAATRAPSFVNIMDEDSVRAILEDHESDSENIAAMWFHSVMTLFDTIIKDGSAQLYRHMMVYDFDDFIADIHDGAARIGEYWSIHYGIESPTWKKDQRGDVPVYLEAKISPSEINWEATLHQQFEWPHEGEIVFTGPVCLKRVTNQDDDTVVDIDMIVRR